MFNLQGSELVIILLLALVVLGPEKLPEAMRKLGNFYAQLRKMSTSFQDEFKSALDEPMREVRDTANILRDSADFRKLQTGGRAEKPKSAEMPSARPTGEPTADVPFDPVTMVPPATTMPTVTTETAPTVGVAPAGPSIAPGAAPIAAPLPPPPPPPPGASDAPAAVGSWAPPAPGTPVVDAPVDPPTGEDG